MADEESVLCLIASYNTNLQGHKGLPQDLVDWLTPTLHVSKFLGEAHDKKRRAPDLVAVGFQELLPLHLGFAGFSKQVMQSRISLILSEIEKHNEGAKYTLVASVVNVGVALLLFARCDDVEGRPSLADRISDVQTQWTGCGPLFLGNKGAVGVRINIKSCTGSCNVGRETYTFVNAHLTAHEPQLQKRLNDYDYIVSTLLFPPSSSSSARRSTIYDTTHLFFFGDLNFRVVLPKLNDSTSVDSPHGGDGGPKRASIYPPQMQFDQLTMERNKPISKRRAITYLNEGPFWEFPTTYKYELGSVGKYSGKRTPSWTDRILYASRSDSPNMESEIEEGSSAQTSSSVIENLVYTSVPSYTTSDHKPIVSLLQIHPSPQLHTQSTSSTSISPTSSSIPASLSHHPTYIHSLPPPDPCYILKRYMGRILGWLVGWTWCSFVKLGAGFGEKVGILNFLVGLFVWRWWNQQGERRGVVLPSEDV